MLPPVARKLHFLPCPDSAKKLDVWFLFSGERDLWLLLRGGNPHVLQIGNFGEVGLLEMEKAAAWYQEFCRRGLAGDAVDGVRRFTIHPLLHSREIEFSPDTFVLLSNADQVLLLEGRALPGEHALRIQKLMLRQSLLEVICFDRGMSGTREEIRRLGSRHKELGITPGMYAMWLDALCEAIRKHDPDYTPELERLWRQAMRKSINEMMPAGASQESGGC